MIRRPPGSLQLGALLGVCVCAFVAFMAGAGACSSSSTPAQTAATYAKREAEFCALRVEYKADAQLANAAGVKLDPAPGSPRAIFEAAEDQFCATLADGGP